MHKSGGALGVQKLNPATTLIQRDNQGGSSMQEYVLHRLDVHKKKISYCVRDGSGNVHSEGAIPATRSDLDRWMQRLPQPCTAAMEATIFAGWIYDHLKPQATALKVAHPLMLRAIAAAKKKNDRIDAHQIADCLRCDFLPECNMASSEIRERRRTLCYRNPKYSWAIRSVFTDSMALASYVGIMPREYSSGGQQRLGGVTKQSSPLLPRSAVVLGKGLTFHSLNVEPETVEAAQDALRAQLEAKDVPGKEGSWGHRLPVVVIPTAISSSSTIRMRLHQARLSGVEA